MMVYFLVMNSKGGQGCLRRDIEQHIDTVTKATKFEGIKWLSR